MTSVYLNTFKSVKCKRAFHEHSWWKTSWVRTSWKHTNILFCWNVFQVSILWWRMTFVNLPRWRWTSDFRGFWTCCDTVNVCGSFVEEASVATCCYKRWWWCFQLHLYYHGNIVCIYPSLLVNCIYRPLKIGHIDQLSD